MGSFIPCGTPARSVGLLGSVPAIPTYPHLPPASIQNLSETPCPPWHHTCLLWWWLSKMQCLWGSIDIPITSSYCVEKCFMHLYAIQHRLCLATELGCHSPLVSTAQHKVTLHTDMPWHLWEFQSPCGCRKPWIMKFAGQVLFHPPNVTRAAFQLHLEGLLTAKKPPEG